MEKKIALFIVTVILLCVSNSIVFALSPMGPPKALYGLNRWGVGIEYGNQTMDLEADCMVSEIMIVDLDVYKLPPEKHKHNINNLKSNILMVRVGYGLNDNWDAFVRLGLADAKGDIEYTYSDGVTPEYKGFDGGFGFSWGIGTRATLWEDDKVSWGGLLQITWLEPDESSVSLSGEPRFSGEADIDIEEIQIAVGPTWRVNDSISIYGGPFVNFIDDGDLDISGRTVDRDAEFLIETKGDIEEESQFGGYIGTHLNMDENTSSYIEYQLTSDAWSISVGAAQRF